MGETRREPEDYAKSLLRYLHTDKIADIYEFANSIGLKIKEVDSKSFDGALIRKPGKLKGIIAVRRAIREDGRKKFTIAHEIAHFLLPGHGVKDLHCNAADINSWTNTVAKEKELEANRFAAEILLPSKVLYDKVNKRKATINLAQELATEFGTSLTATVLKCVELTEEACAVIYSENGVIKWSRKNLQFRKFIDSGRLDADSYADNLFRDSSEGHLNGATRADTWIRNDMDEDSSIWEDSIFLPHYNSVLTILTLE